LDFLFGFFFLDLDVAFAFDFDFDFTKFILELLHIWLDPQCEVLRIFRGPGVLFHYKPTVSKQ